MHYFKALGSRLNWLYIELVICNLFCRSRERILNASATEASIQDLKPFTKYSIRVITYNDYGVNNNATPITVETNAEGETQMLK